MTTSKLASIVIGIIIFSMIVVGMTVPMADLAGKYGENVNTSYQSVYDKTNLVSSNTENTYNTFQNSSVEETSFGVSKVQSAFNSISLIFLAPGIVYDILSHLALDLRLPTWFLIGFMAIFIVSLVFLIAGIFLKWFT